MNTTNMSNEIIDIKSLQTVSEHLYNGVSAIIDKARTQVAVYVNAHVSMTFWNVGKYIIDDMDYQTYSAYGKKILATLSQRLTSRYGKGYTYSALTRMMKVARMYCDREMFAMLSQTLTWSHFLELVTIEDPTVYVFPYQPSPQKILSFRCSLGRFVGAIPDNSSREGRCISFVFIVLSSAIQLYSVGIDYFSYFCSRVCEFINLREGIANST